MVRPKKPKCPVCSREKCISGPSREIWVAPAKKKKTEHPKGFSKAFLKAGWGRGIPGFGISSCTFLWFRSTLPVFRLHICMINWLIASIWWWYLASEKLRKYAWGTIIWVLQRGATAGVYGGGVCPGKAPWDPAWSWLLSVPLFCDLMDCSLQFPLSMGFSRQEYWSGWPCPPPGDLSKPGIKPTSPALVG